MVSMQSLCVAVSAAAAVLAHLNTLPADFAFDDNFAIVSIGGSMMVYELLKGTTTTG